MEYNNYNNHLEHKNLEDYTLKEIINELKWIAVKEDRAKIHIEFGEIYRGYQESLEAELEERIK